MNWYDISDLGVRGRAWDASQTAHLYDRLPARAEAIATENVWRLSRQSAGMYVDFVSDADTISARTMLRNVPPLEHLSLRYLDLYCRDDDRMWRWAGVSAGGIIASGPGGVLVGGVPRQKRHWRLYLPLQYDVERIEIGVPDDASVEALPLDDRRPIVIYGTSIVHGAAGPSRPGMVWPSIVGRRLNWPVVNLGFSGSARMEPPLGEVFTDLEPSIFVIDPLPNMSLDVVNKNAEQFLRIYTKARPNVPLLLIEDREHTNGWLKPDYREAQRNKRAAFEAIARKLKAEGCLIEYIHGDGLLGFDSEATTDASHPSDLGCMRQADVVTPVLMHMLSSL